LVFRQGPVKASYVVCTSVGEAPSPGFIGAFGETFRYLGMGSAARFTPIAGAANNPRHMIHWRSPFAQRLREQATSRAACLSGSQPLYLTIHSRTIFVLICQCSSGFQQVGEPSPGWRLDLASPASFPELLAAERQRR